MKKEESCITESTENKFYEKIKKQSLKINSPWLTQQTKKSLILIEEKRTSHSPLSQTNQHHHRE